MVPAVGVAVVVVVVAVVFVGTVDPADVVGSVVVLERRMLVREERRWTPAATATTVERQELLQQAIQNSRS